MSGIDSAFDDKEHEGFDMSEWIKWYGGECPVDPHQPVEVQIAGLSSHGKDAAGNFFWSRHDAAGDILAYRVVSQENDNVNTPPHYASGNLECIDAIREMLTKEQFKGMLAGNVMKYIWRRDYKGKPLEDSKKAKWYLERLIEEYENDV